MAKRALFFSVPMCLNLRNGQMVIRPDANSDAERTVPVEDIGYVVLEHQQTSISLPLLNALSDNNAAVIICGRNCMPNAMLMNLDSNTTQGETFRLQIDASEPLKKGLWRQTVEAKIRNQAGVLHRLGKDGDLLKPYYRNVKSGDCDNREGVAAKLYWNELFGRGFVREREGVEPNNMLNYGYTILRAAVARALMGSGLFPAFGIFHRNRYNAFPLADDVMEPFRPYVDEMVFNLFEAGAMDLTKEVKSELMHLLYVDTVFDGIMRPLETGLTVTTASLAGCMAGKSKKIIFPVIK